MPRAAEALLELGPSAVLVKGGHLEGPEASDLFARDGEQTWITGVRLDVANTHGTGCTLSAAIAAYLAMGRDLEEAVRGGKRFVTEAIRHALSFGAGVGPVDQLWGIERPKG
jgi:hydroxymethylpyrimidine/phosphomethylpyrimidine kinase